MAMKSSDLRQMSLDELKDKETDLAEQLFALRLQKSTGQLDNPSRLREARRDLARILTVQREMAS